MNLDREKWTKKDITEFNKYLESLKQEEKIEFTKRIVNTKMEVLGIPVPALRNVAKEIQKGNVLTFLDQEDNKFYENTMINACLVNTIKDFDTHKEYLEKLYLDNWSTVDILKFNIKDKERDYLKLAKQYLKSKEPFIRRVGVRILFSYTKQDDVEKIFKIIDTLYKEQEYYVNMAVAWLVCELMIHNREKTLAYLEHHHLNDFTINKASSKCRDSFRVSKEDKKLLLKYKAISERGRKSKRHYAYMVECADGSIYSGYTTDLEKREKAHNSGKGAKYTRNRLPVKIVYYEEFDNKVEATRREYEFKQYTRKEKLEIIEKGQGL